MLVVPEYFFHDVHHVNLMLGTIHLRRQHVLGGEGGSPLPMFANARGEGF